MNITAKSRGSQSLRWQILCLILFIASPLLAADTGVTFLVTSDSHYDAFENEDRNERDRVTIDQMNGIASVSWPDELGGGLIGQPRGVLLLGDVIDDGDRMKDGKNQSEQQNRYFLADFGLDGTDGRLKYPVFEGWGNHDGPPEGRERFGFSFQKQLQQRNAQRLQRGLIDHVSEKGLHYSWNWGDVHFVQLNLFPADKPHPEIRYSPQYHDPQNALAFLKGDLSGNLTNPNQPVVVAHHYDLQGTDWWHDEQRKAYYEAIRPYNIVAVFHGHTGTGVYQWKPKDEQREPLHVINTGQTENGFFVVQITADRIRLGYRAKMNVQVIRQPDRTERREWDGTWGWRFLHCREMNN
jgi:cytolysin (calcineurin-like family phosphatase)